MDSSAVLSYAGLGALIYAITEGLKRVALTYSATTVPPWKRWLPLFPIGLGVLLGICLPSLALGKTLAEHGASGALAGAFCGQMHEQVQRAIFKKLPAVPEAATPPADPPAAPPTAQGGKP